MADEILPRREFLKATTGLITGLVVAGSPLALIAPGRAWAVDLTAFTSPEGTVLMRVSRTIMPHDKLDDAAYALVIQAIDRDATKDSNLHGMIHEGIASLGSGFASKPEAERVAALKKIEASEFFRTMRRRTVEILYTTPMAYAYFGYEGEAFTKGGYLTRGFNDLRWLPEVPIEDSGPMPI
ncbi:MAG TPA: tat (twin-arginine translocation) pathway signal sequence [Verrucomicrobiae bacterium]|nr:tat (twin-arginine translocation) pathway signal sequence [Verrucomicrobiae bacterium]